VKSSGRDEPIWVVIHVCMKTTQGIPLYSYLYLKLTKVACFSHYLLCFFFKKKAEQVLAGGGGYGMGRQEVEQIVYTHVRTCKNNKIKFKKEVKKKNILYF
jgi:hypothetical protein